MTDPAAWVAARIAEAPAGLRERLERAAFTATFGRGERGFRDALTEAADQLLASSLTPGASTPAAPATPALQLLTADALVTLACEWVAEREPASLAELR